MGLMKQFVIDQEEMVCDELYERVEDCADYQEFAGEVIEAYKNNDYLSPYVTDDIEYVHDVAWEIWSEKTEG